LTPICLLALGLFVAVRIVRQRAAMVDPTDDNDNERAGR
jgi:hypothetical protein